MRKCFFKNWSEVEIFSFVRGRIDRSCFHNSRLHYYGTFYGSFLYSCRILCNHHDARLCIAHRLGSRRKRDEWIQEKERNWNAFKDLLRYLSPFLPLLPFTPPSCIPYPAGWSARHKAAKEKEVEWGKDRERCNWRSNLVANPTFSPQTIKHWFMSAYFQTQARTQTQFSER